MVGLTEDNMFSIEPVTFGTGEEELTAICSRTAVRLQRWEQLCQVPPPKSFHRSPRFLNLQTFFLDYPFAVIVNVTRNRTFLESTPICLDKQLFKSSKVKINEENDYILYISILYTAYKY